MTTELETALRALADAQRAEEGATRDVDGAVSALNLTPEGCAWHNSLVIQADRRQAVRTAQENARAAILASYELDGNRHPAPGAGIRVSKGKLTVTDNDLALAWAEEHMPAAVIKSVDADLLAAWAARQPALPTWMTRAEDRVTPTIASNLVELYPEEL